MASITNDILRERLNQDDQWGGPAHDDRNTWFDWRGAFYKQLSNGSMVHTAAEQRECLVKIAAIAQAALESFDRKN